MNSFGISGTVTDLVNTAEEQIKEQFKKIEEIAELKADVSEETINNIVEKRLKKEVSKGVQTIQYQVITLMTTNGQAPFLSVCMYLGETEEYKESIEKMWKQNEAMLMRYIHGVIGYVPEKVGKVSTYVMYPTIDTHRSYQLSESKRFLRTK